jgi:hypothetical protein
VAGGGGATVSAYVHIPQSECCLGRLRLRYSPQSFSFSRVPQQFSEPECSLPYSQKPSSGPYVESKGIEPSYSVVVADYM